MQLSRATVTMGPQNMSGSLVFTGGIIETGTGLLALNTGNSAENKHTIAMCRR